MIGFFRQGQTLVCDGVSLADLADAHGTPLYVYSAATIASRYRAIDDAFAAYPHTIHYALKANSNASTRWRANDRRARASRCASIPISTRRVILTSRPA